MKMVTQTTKTELEPVSSNKQRRQKKSFFSAQHRQTEPFFGPSSIQPKLEIGSPNDKYEQEADRVAGMVMRMPNPGMQASKGESVQRKPLVQRVSSNGGEKQSVSAEISNKISSTSGLGSPLPTNTQHEMSSKIGADFSDVKVHTDNTAVQLSQNLGAKAFTVGNDIYFNEGQYKPTTTEGKRLMAHELVHTVQQRGGEKIRRQEFPNQNHEESMSDPSLWCTNLIELIEFEQNHGRLNTLIEYNPVNNDLLVGLNYDIPSIYGLVDVDWMLRLTYTQVGTILPSIISPSIAEGMGIITSHLHYFAAKSFWNTLRSSGTSLLHVFGDLSRDEVIEFELNTLFHNANLNAPTVVTHWIHGTESLSEIFAPALEICKNR